MIINQTIQRFITASILGSLFWLVFFYFPVVVFSYLLLGILATILVVEWKNIFKLNDFWFWFIMPWYPILPFALLIYLNSDPCYRILIYYLFVVVFAFDGTAYIVGSLLGKNKIVPRISPGKTVEGCIGGFVGALIMFYLAAWSDRLIISPVFAFLFVLIMCLFAFVGDIFESFLKRQANIKDSGNILPGHGGFLDRFDAVMMTTFFVFLYRHELIHKLCMVG